MVRVQDGGDVEVGHVGMTCNCHTFIFSSNRASRVVKKMKNDYSFANGTFRRQFVNRFAEGIAEDITGTLKLNTGAVRSEFQIDDMYSHKFKYI